MIKISSSNSASNGAPVNPNDCTHNSKKWF